MPRLTIDKLVPDGIQATDHLHIETNDGTCSRCRKPIDDAEVPLMFWTNDGHDMWQFCERCCGVSAAQRAERKWGPD